MGGDSAPAGDRAVLLELPDEVPVEAHSAAWALDEAIGDDLAGRVGALRDSHFDFLGAVSRVVPYDDLWPRSLHIPRGAAYQDHWPFPAPDDHRYSHEWTSPGANSASRDTGNVSAFAQVVDPGTPSVRSEAGVGARFSPTASLGVVEVGPDLSASGTAGRSTCSPTSSPARSG